MTGLRVRAALRRSASFTVTVVLTVIVLTIPVGSVRAQDPSMIDEGRFEIFVGGASRGQESFAIRRQGEEYMAVGRSSLEGEDLLVQSAEIGLRTDARFVPVRYEFRTLQRPSSTTIAVRTGSRIRVTTSNREGERMTELLADREMVLVQTGVAHHYWFLIQRFVDSAPGTGGTVDALAPGAVNRSAIRLEAVEEVELSFPGRAAIPAKRYDILIGDTRHIVWTDLQSGHILRAEIPERAWAAVRLFEPPSESSTPDDDQER
jgi:hypothetical protein